MANDDWRFTIEVEEAEALTGRLGGTLSAEAAELAEELKERKLAVSCDDETLFVYAGTRSEAEKAQGIVEAELRANGIGAKTSRIEHWLEDEERWDDEPPGKTWEEQELEQGYAPWEVRVQCSSRGAARDLAERLEQEGYRPVRRFHYLIVGAASREDAETLAQRLHGEVEAGGEIVLEAEGANPFAVFGGLGQ